MTQVLLQDAESKQLIVIRIAEDLSLHRKLWERDFQFVGVALGSVHYHSFRIRAVDVEQIVWNNFLAVLVFPFDFLLLDFSKFILFRLCSFFLLVSIAFQWLIFLIPVFVDVLGNVQNSFNDHVGLLDIAARIPVFNALQLNFHFQVDFIITVAIPSRDNEQLTAVALSVSLQFDRALAGASHYLCEWHITLTNEVVFLIIVRVHDLESEELLFLKPVVHCDSFFELRVGSVIFSFRLSYFHLWLSFLPCIDDHIAVIF